MASGIRYSRQRGDAASSDALIGTCSAQKAGSFTVAESMLPACRGHRRGGCRRGVEQRLARPAGGRRGWGPHDGDGFARLEELRKNWHGRENRIAVWMAPRAFPQTTPEFLASAAEYASREDCSMSLHFANSKAQYDWVAAELGRTRRKPH